MARDGLDASDTHDTFDIPGWHEEVALWLDFCEEYWRHFRREREVMRLGPLTDYRGGDKVPYYEIENRYGRHLPGVARAAAGLRRSLALAIEHLLPETSVALPDGEDEVERAMAASAGWEEAVEIAFADISRMKKLLAAARPTWGVTAATDFPRLVGLLRDELERQTRAFETAARPVTATLSTRPIATTDFTRPPADRINKAVIEALAPGAMTELSRDCLGPSGPAVDLRLGYLFRSRRPRGKDFLAGVVGLREEPDVSLLGLLRRLSDLAVKIHLALWERAYLEAAVAGVSRSEAEPPISGYVTTTVARLCDNIGLKRKKGAHRREGREAAVALLRLLTSLELICVDARPGPEFGETEGDPRPLDAGEASGVSGRGKRPVRSKRERAYRREGRVFLPLARELSLKVYEADHYFKYHGLPPEDILFCLFLWGFYHKFSSRRFDFILEDVLRRRLIWKKPAPNTLLYHLRQKALTPILLRLIGVAALPFRFYDWGYAMDATKIFTSVYLEEEERGDGRKRFKWLKLHLLSGVKSQAVMAARVTRWPAHEMKYLEPLLRDALARGFEVKSLTADRATSLKITSGCFMISASPSTSPLSGTTGRVKGAQTRSGTRIWNASGRGTGPI